MRLRQFEPFMLSDFELEEYPLPRHNHTYYKVISIYQGSGQYCLNSNTFNHYTGDQFLLTPEDKHYLMIDQKTRFVFLKFTDSFFYNQRHTSPGFFDREVEPVMRNKFTQEIKPELTAADKVSLKSFFNSSWWRHLTVVRCLHQPQPVNFAS